MSHRTRSTEELRPGSASLRLRACARVALVAAGAFAAPLGAQTGLPFTEPFDNTNLRAPGTSADWGTTAVGELRLPLANAVTHGFSAVMTGEDLPGSFTTRLLALADLDGDGDLDLVEGASGKSGVYLNDGLGVFAARVDFPSPNANTRGVAVGDVDADGDLDVVLGNLDSRAQLLLNAGDGITFTVLDVSSEVRPTDYLVLADVDADGDLDVVTANHMQRNRIYTNTGDPLQPFGPAGDAGRDLGTFGQNAQAVAAGDVDNDGDVDIVSLNENQHNRVHLNDGAGNFGMSSIGTDEDDTQGGALGDLNGDGFLDLVVGNTTAGQVSKVYFNNATGTSPIFGAGVAFTAPNNPDFGRAVVLADADNDGDLDIFLSTAGAIVTPTFADYLYLNDGAGTFASFTPIGADLHVANSVAVGDIDADGDVDVITGNEARDSIGGALPAVNRVYRNAATPTAGPAVLQLSAHATSLRVDAETSPIASVQLDVLPAAYGAHNAAAFWVSSNAGVSWVHAVPGRPVLIPAAKQGADLRWRTFLSALSPAATVGAAGFALDSVAIALNSSGPSREALGDQSATQDAPFTLDAAFTDADGDEVYHSLAGMPAGSGLSIDPLTGAIGGTPNAADTAASPITLTVTASDGALQAQQTFNLTVAGLPGSNQPPVFTSTALTTATEGTAYLYTIAATDPDGGALIITAPTLPAWLALTDNGDGTAVLAGTPAAGHVGVNSVQLVVTDAASATATQAFDVTVAAAASPNPSPPAPPPASSSDGGGGSTAPWELLILAVLAAALRLHRRLAAVRSSRRVPCM